MDISVGCVLCYIIGGVLAYGVTLAYLQRVCSKNPEIDFETDRFIAAFFAALGFLGLILFVVTSTMTTGMMFRNPHKPATKRKKRHLHVVK